MRFTILMLIIVVSHLVPSTGWADDQPNIIVFLTDDQGWGDLGCYGHPRIKSPNLDQFATEGLRLTQCYAGCSVCSPSRSAILTGRTPYRNGVWRWIPSGSQYHLPTSEITIAEILKERGYDTCHVGKWHLNGKFNSDEQPQPDDHGYDHWMATQNNAAPNHLNPTNFVRNGQEVGRVEGPSSIVCVEEAIRWLESRKDSGNPFFLTVWTHEPHLPIESAEKYMRPYADIDDEGMAGSFARRETTVMSWSDTIRFSGFSQPYPRAGYRPPTHCAGSNREILKSRQGSRSRADSQPADSIRIQGERFGV